MPQPPLLPLSTALLTALLAVASFIVGQLFVKFILEPSGQIRASLTSLRFFVSLHHDHLKAAAKPDGPAQSAEQIERLISIRERLMEIAATLDSLTGTVALQRVAHVLQLTVPEWRLPELSFLLREIARTISDNGTVDHTSLDHYLEKVCQLLKLRPGKMPWSLYLCTMEHGVKVLQQSGAQRLLRQKRRRQGELGLGPEMDAS